MSIIPIPAFKDNYIWAIVNEQQHTLICVDPGDAAPVLEYVRRNHLQLTSVLITHHHSDHCAGIEVLLQTFPKLTIYAPNDDRIPHAKILLRDEDILHIDHYAFRVLHIPGHTSSHICYQEPTKAWLFCGDTLFSAGCGRVFDGTMKQLFNSLQLLQTLPEDTQVYCGHEYTRQNLRFAAEIEPENEHVQAYAQYLNQHPLHCSLPSTIGLEKKINPFFRTQCLEGFAQLHDISPTDSLAIFTKLRTLKDTF
jgi:hydroxyacylglutathione hydrolase